MKISGNTVEPSYSVIKEAEYSVSLLTSVVLSKQDNDTFNGEELIGTTGCLSAIDEVQL